jgi:hypothetical protein
MRTIPSVIAVFLATHALASPQSVLDANKAASGNWAGKAALELDYAYSGQGLSGTTKSLIDLKRGGFVDSFAIGPTSGANGYDGKEAWLKERSGTVTPQAGGDTLTLAVNEVYRDGNLWWRADRGGAKITDQGRKTENGTTYDVLTVAPHGGKPFEARFDATTHLLTRTVEVQVTQTIVTDYSDYRAVDGAQVAGKSVVDDGSHNLQTSTLTSARFQPELPANACKQPAEDVHDYTIAGGAHQATVPFQLINNHIYADVSVNGAKPALFIFDTGGHDILGPSFAKALGVKAQGSQTASGAGDALNTSGIARVKSFRIGDATITEQPVDVMDIFSPGVEGVQAQGMAGYEFFARFVTRFDYGSSTITFFDRRFFDPTDAGTAVPMRLFQQFPEVDGTYDGIPGRFGIDTGARTALSLTGPFAAKNDIRPKPGSLIAAVTGWGVGGPSRGIVMPGDLLTLGSVRIEHPLTEVGADKGGAMAAEAFPNNVGGGVLKRFVVTIDYQHMILYLMPVPGPVADLDTFDRSGMWINEADDGYKIVEVSKGAPAESAGLAAGDIILAVDGRPAKSIALSDLRRQLRNQAPGTVVKLSVRRGADTRDIALTLRDLL